MILVAALLTLVGALTGERVYAATGAESGHGRWSQPLAERPHVLTPFDPPAQRWLSGHRGIDLAGPSGATVRAVADGIVVWAAPIAGVGVVSVEHADGLRSTYEPVDAVVAAGDVVLRGDVLGTLAPDGHCLPRACLHLGARRGSSYLDPALLLGLRPPRLLPYLSTGTSPSAGTFRGGTTDPPERRSDSAAASGAATSAAEPPPAADPATVATRSSPGSADLSWRQVVQEAAPGVVAAVLRGVAAWLSAR